MSEKRADAISGDFEALSIPIADLAKQVQNVIIGQRIEMVLLLIMVIAVLAPYMGSGK